MKAKTFILAAMSAWLFSSCGGSKSTLDSYERTVNPGQTRKSTLRESNPILKLASEKTANLRAAQAATSKIEDVALENAENAAAQALAGRIESVIYGVRERFNQNNQVDDKTLTEQQVRNLIRTKIKQKISYKVIGEPAIYDNSDGSVTVWVCVELTKPTNDIMSDLHRDLTNDDVIGTSYKRDKFLEDIKSELDKLINE